MGRVRLKDLAERYGVSTSTASRALAGSPGVREDLRRRLLEEAREVGYPLPDGLQGQRVLVAASGPAMTDYGRNQFTWLVLEGMRERAAALGLGALQHPRWTASWRRSRRAGRRPARRRRAAHRRRAEVLGSCACHRAPGGARQWRRSVDADPASHPATAPRRGWRPTICSLTAIATLLFVMRPGRTTIQRRLEGWRDALRRRGLPAGDERVLRVEDWLPELAEGALRPTSTRRRPVHGGPVRRRQPRRRGDEGARGARPQGAVRRLGHGDGRPAGGRVLAAAADHDAHPEPRDGRPRPRHAAASRSTAASDRPAASSSPAAWCCEARSIERARPLELTRQGDDLLGRMD